MSHFQNYINSTNSLVDARKIDIWSKAYQYIDEDDISKRNLKLNEVFGINNSLRHGSQWLYNELREKEETHEFSLEIVIIYFNNLSFLNSKNIEAMDFIRLVKKSNSNFEKVFEYIKNES